MEKNLNRAILWIKDLLGSYSFYFYSFALIVMLLLVYFPFFTPIHEELHYGFCSLIKGIPYRVQFMEVQCTIVGDYWFQLLQGKMFNAFPLIVFGAVAYTLGYLRNRVRNAKTKEAIRFVMWVVIFYILAELLGSLLAPQSDIKNLLFKW